MLKNVRLRLLPNVTNCLAWSPEGALAIVAGEDVVILVPKFASQNTGTKRPQQFWHARANMRQLIIDSMDEEIVPADSNFYSVGEEQGPGYAKEIRWSPLGASRYRRCLFAVLSTNHKIYIFEPVGHISADMRVLHDLTALMSSCDKLPAYQVDSIPKNTRQRLRSRCKAMAWSPPCRAEGNRWGESLLAVANDCLEIVLFRVLLGKIEVVGYVSPFSPGDTAKWLGKRLTHAQALCWSPWKQCGERKYWAFLAYASNGHVLASRVTLDMEDGATPKVEVGPEPLLLGGAISERHPVYSIAFAPEEVGGRLVVAFAVQLCTTVMTFTDDGKISSGDEFKNNFIETVSGLAFAPCNTPNTTIIQVLTLRGSSQDITFTVSSTPDTSISTIHSNNDTAMIDVPTEEEARSIALTWPVILAEMKQDYMAEYEIPNAAIRGYGLAVSPLGGVTAVAISLHPKDSLEYITASNEKTVIIFGTAPGSSGSWKSFVFTPEGMLPNPITTATEAVLLEAMALGDLFTSRVDAAIAAATAEDNLALEAISFSEGEDVEEFLAKHTLLSKPLNALQYAAALKSISRSNAREALPENPRILASAVVAALSMPRTLCEDEESKRILYSLACVGIMGMYQVSTILSLAKSAFEWLDANTAPEVRFELELGIVAMRERGVEGEGDMKVENGFVSSLEKCRICTAGMVWRDLRIAECTNGHRFSRCALTFLPITDPKVTRECSVCSRTILGGAVDKGGEERRGLAGAVFGGWEACLLCGGRYWAEIS